MSLTDFNDLHCAVGLEAVRAQLMAALEPPSAPAGAARDDTPPSKARSASKGGEGAGGAPPPGSNWLDAMTRTDKGGFQANIANAELVLRNDARWKGVLGYCDFSYRIVKRLPPPFSGGEVGEWTDADSARMRIWMTRNYGFTPKSSDADDAVMVAAQEARFHPVREYLQGLTWDGKSRVSSWLTEYLGVQSRAECPQARERYDRYVALAGRKWLISAVARVMRAPVKADCVLILEGPQGLGKSTALAILGGEWFSDTHFALGEKDGYQQMQGLWLCELAELDSFNKAESTRAKQFFGAESDRYRPSYGRRAQTFARQCIFAGTTNQDSYLKDPTGNRRYWPVFCHRLDAERLRADRDQLWAEAMEMYIHGMPWWVLDDDRELFEEEQEKRAHNDVWEDLIESWLRDPENHNPDMVWTTAEIMAGALDLQPHQMQPPQQTRVGLIMSRLRFSKSKRTVRLMSGKKARKHVYEMPEGWLSS